MRLSGTLRPGPWLAAAVFTAFAAGDAAAVDIRWHDWGKGREVASGKMVKWSVNKSGHIYLNNARKGADWNRCKQPGGFRGLHIAAAGSRAFVSSDDQRVVQYRKNPKTGACATIQEMKRTPVLVRDLAYDGRSLRMLGEDGQLYAYVQQNWKKMPIGGKDGLTVFAQSGRNAPGNVICTWPLTKAVLLTDAKHGQGLIGGRNRPRHEWVNKHRKPYGQDAIWIVERLDSKHCLFRLKDFASGKYLVAGDNYDSGLYIQHHQNRTNALWRLVSGRNGTVSLVDYKHGRAITAGDNYDGKLYHQELTPVSARANIAGRTNQWWNVKAADPVTYQIVNINNNQKACNLPRRKHIRIDDLKHKRSLRWQDGNHGSGFLEDKATWSLRVVKRTGAHCAYQIVSHGGTYILAAGDNYDGKIYVHRNESKWAKKDNALWAFQGQGKNTFIITDRKHKRQLVAGNNYDGNVYHEHGNNRSNSRWEIRLIHGESPEKHVRIYGNGKAAGVGVQPMRISADPYFKRWWLTGSDNTVRFHDAKAGWKAFGFEALDVHVNDEGAPYVLSPDLKLYRPTTGEAAKANWGGYKALTSNAMRFDVDPLGYPVVVRHAGVNQLSHTFPQRDSSVPGAGSCSGSSPWGFLSDYAKGRFNKLVSNYAALAKGVASGDFNTMITSMAAVGAGNMFDETAFLGAVLEQVPVAEVRIIGAITKGLKQSAYEGWANAVKGDVEMIHKTRTEVLVALATGNFKGAGEAIANNPALKYYLLGPIVETDWDQDPLMIALQIRAKYTIRTLVLMGELKKYTPAGAAKYAAKSAFKQAFTDHGPAFAHQVMGRVRTLNARNRRIINTVLAMAAQGMEDGDKPFPLYSEATLKDAAALQVWTDKGSGADSDGSFWRPKLSPGCISLGDLGQSGYDKPKMKQVCNAAKGRGKWWEYPTGFELIWSDRCSGADSDGSVWLPRCKPGYVAVGFVTNNTADLAPWRDRVACLKASPNFATYQTLDKAQVRTTWNDKGSGAKQDVEVFTRKFGGYPLMYAWPERRGLNEARRTRHWSAIARIGDKAGAERAMNGTARSAKVYRND